MNKAMTHDEKRLNALEILQRHVVLQQATAIATGELAAAAFAAGYHYTAEQEFVTAFRMARNAQALQDAIELLTEQSATLEFAIAAPAIYDPVNDQERAATADAYLRRTGDASALRHALWNIAGTIVAIVEDASEEARAIACTETSPLVDGARDAIKRFGLSNETAAPAPPETPMRPSDSWAVSVERNGENVVCLASNEMSGRDLQPGDDDAIRTAAQHLLSFVGQPDAAPFLDDDPAPVPETPESHPSVVPEPHDPSTPDQGGEAVQRVAACPMKNADRRDGSSAPETPEAMERP